MAFSYYPNLTVLEDTRTSACFDGRLSFPRRWEEKPCESATVWPWPVTSRMGDVGVGPQRKRLLLCLRGEGCCHVLWMSVAGSSHCQNPSWTACCCHTPRKPERTCVSSPVSGAATGSRLLGSSNHADSNEVLRNLWCFPTSRDDCVSYNWA